MSSRTTGKHILHITEEVLTRTWSAHMGAEKICMASDMVRGVCWED